MGKLKRFYLRNVCYFITSTARNKEPFFEKDEIKEVLINNLNFYRRKLNFEINGYVIMPDHLHLLITPRGGFNLSQIMKSFKSFTTKEIKKILNKSMARKPWVGIDSIWQHQFYDHVIRDEEDLKTRLDYMHNNPLKAGLVEKPEDYKYSSFANYHNHDNPIIKIDILTMHSTA